MFSRVQLFATPCTVAHQAPHGDSSGKNTGVGCHARPMDLPNPGIEPRSSTQASHIAGRFFTAEPKRLPAVRETRVLPLGWEDPLEKEMATSPVLLPRKFHGWRSLGYSPWGRKESDMTERLHFHFHFHFQGLPWRRQWHPTPVLLPGESQGWRTLVGSSPWGC